MCKSALRIRVLYYSNAHSFYIANIGFSHYWLLLYTYNIYIYIFLIIIRTQIKGLGASKRQIPRLGSTYGHSQEKFIGNC